MNHLKNTLIELNCGSNNCGIDQEGIKELTMLQKIDAVGNKKIDIKSFNL